MELYYYHSRGRISKATINFYIALNRHFVNGIYFRRANSLVYHFAVPRLPCVYTLVGNLFV